MVILIIGKFSQDQFGFHISDSLKDMGHQTIEFDPTIKYKYSKTVFGRRVYQVKAVLINNLINTSWYRQFRVRRLKYILEKNKIDLTITTHDFLYPEEVTLIREKTKSHLVMWFPDSVSGFNKAFFLISDYDFLFFKDPYIVKTLTENYNKKNVYYLPECCNPKFHKSISLTEDDLNKYGCDITTYGNPHNVRTSFFSQLLNYQYDIKIWGHQPSIWLKDKKLKSLYTGECVFNESKAKSVLAAKINLNTLHPSEIIGLNARTFEIAGIGGFQMIHWRPGLADLFEDAKEIVSFNNFDELIEKINYYLKSPAERANIAEAGQKRAYTYHTYILRLQLLFDTINGNARGFSLPNNNFPNIYE
jgi:spore maturation protein CgeB